MEQGSKMYPPCIATRAGSRPPDVCRIPSTTPLRKVVRCYVHSARCRQRRAAGKTRYRMPKELKLGS
jgi:hypothetical protein